MKWQLVIPPKVQELLRKFPPQTKRYIRQAFLEIAKNPTESKPLKDELSGLHAFRVKNFRVVYKIDEPLRVVRVMAVGPRRTIYEDLTLSRREAA